MTMNDPRDEVRHPSGLDSSAVSLNRTVDALSADELAEPSLLPGWTRAHVVAHLALNGYAMAGVVDGVGRGEDRWRCTSPTSSVTPTSGSSRRPTPRSCVTGCWRRPPPSPTRWRPCPRTHWDGVFTRTPGSAPWPAVTIVETRRRELEIHHVDLGASYTQQDWPDDFVLELLDVVTVDQAGSGPFLVRATDLGRDWTVGGEGGPVVVGTGADLGWWLTGRGEGEGLANDAGTLPQLGPWQRATGSTGA